MASLTDSSTNPAKRKVSHKPRPSDIFFRSTVTVFGLVNLLILSAIGAFLLVRGLSVFNDRGLDFLTQFEWQAYVDENGETVTDVGIGAMLIGTVVIALIALFVAVPISVLTALYLNFYAPTKIKGALTTVIDLMASFPSILFGLWGYFVLMPSAEYWAKLINKYFGWIPLFDVPSPLYTRSPFVAGLVLSVMIIPIVTSVSREVFSQTPLDRIQAAFALGASKIGMIRAVVLPFGANGAVGGAMLGLGRAFGETVAIYTVLNIVYDANLKILFGTGGNVASHIILRWGEAGQDEVKALLAAGFVLFVLTLLVNFAADFTVRRTVRKGK
ncbi:MAG: hypothetical protein RLZZ320_548 [Actinomycetota bacterium]